MILAGLLAGCRVQSSATPLPLVPLDVKITPTLDWLRPSMAACAVENPAISLTVQSADPADQSLDAATILLRWTDAGTENGQTFKLGEDHLAVIVNPDNPLVGMDLAKLTAVYSGAVVDWLELAENTSGVIQPWVYPAGDDTQTLFGNTVLPFDEITGTARIAPDPETMLASVNSDPLALGLVPARWLDGSVKEIEITDVSERDWTLPILATTAQKPEGPTRDWLLCVQDKIEP